MNLSQMAPCYEVKWIGDPALVEIPVTTSVFAVLSADQQRAAVVMDHCWKPRLQSILSQKAVLLSIATAAIVMYQFVAMRGMLGPLVSLLG